MILMYIYFIVKVVEIFIKMFEKKLYFCNYIIKIVVKVGFDSEVILGKWSRLIIIESLRGIDLIYIFVLGLVDLRCICDEWCFNLRIL